MDGNNSPTAPNNMKVNNSPGSAARNFSAEKHSLAKNEILSPPSKAGQFRPRTAGKQICTPQVKRIKNNFNSSNIELKSPCDSAEPQKAKIVSQKMPLSSDCSGQVVR